jgi:hypothetical protein
MQFNRVNLITVLAGVVTLAGCGAESPETVGPATSAPEAAQPSAAVEETKEMVSGVTNTTKPGAPVELKFDLQDRPVAGAPVAIEIALLPLKETPFLRATFIATDGLAVQKSPTAAEYRDAKAGAVYRHTLTVIPREDGAYYVSAIVLMDMENGAEARTFSIPVIVGEPQAPASKPEPPVDATGQAIQSMPAS